MTTTRRHAPGFTLIELLIVFAILGILATLGVGSFQTARLKARDVNRKSDLATISKSLEAYVNDHQSYPGSSGGSIICITPATTCQFGDPFADAQGTLYAAKLPTDPIADQDYVYESDGITYTLYARLENEQDPDVNSGITTQCGGATCNYTLKSPNQL